MRKSLNSKYLNKNGSSSLNSLAERNAPYNQDQQLNLNDLINSIKDSENNTVITEDFSKQFYIPTISRDKSKTEHTRYSLEQIGAKRNEQIQSYSLRNDEVLFTNQSFGVRNEQPEIMDIQNNDSLEQQNQNDEKYKEFLEYSAIRQKQFEPYERSELNSTGKQSLTQKLKSNKSPAKLINQKVLNDQVPSILNKQASLKSSSIGENLSYSHIKKEQRIFNTSHLNKRNSDLTRSQSQNITQNQNFQKRNLFSILELLKNSEYSNLNGVSNLYSKSQTTLEDHLNVNLTETSNTLMNQYQNSFQQSKKESALKNYQQIYLDRQKQNNVQAGNLFQSSQRDKKFNSIEFARSVSEIQSLQNTASKHTQPSQERIFNKFNEMCHQKFEDLQKRYDQSKFIFQKQKNSEFISQKIVDYDEEVLQRMKIIERLMGDKNQDAKFIKDKFVQIAIVNSNRHRNIVIGRGTGKEKSNSNNIQNNLQQSFSENTLLDNFKLFSNNLTPENQTSNGSSEANKNPLESIKKIIQREKPNIQEAIKPDPVIQEQSRWCPKHVLKMVELEDVIAQQKYPSSSVFSGNQSREVIQNNINNSFQTDSQKQFTNLKQDQAKQNLKFLLLKGKKKISLKKSELKNINEEASSSQLQTINEESNYPNNRLAPQFGNRFMQSSESNMTRNHIKKLKTSKQVDQMNESAYQPSPSIINNQIFNHSERESIDRDLNDFTAAIQKQALSKLNVQYCNMNIINNSVIVQEVDSITEKKNGNSESSVNFSLDKRNLLQNIKFKNQQFKSRMHFIDQEDSNTEIKKQQENNQSQQFLKNNDQNFSFVLKKDQVSENNQIEDNYQILNEDERKQKEEPSTIKLRSSLQQNENKTGFDIYQDKNRSQSNVKIQKSDIKNSLENEYKDTGKQDNFTLYQHGKNQNINTPTQDFEEFVLQLKSNKAVTGLNSLNSSNSYSIKKSIEKQTLIKDRSQSMVQNSQQNEIQFQTGNTSNRKLIQNMPSHKFSIENSEQQKKDNYYQNNCDKQEIPKQNQYQNQNVEIKLEKQGDSTKSYQELKNQSFQKDKQKQIESDDESQNFFLKGKGIDTNQKQGIYQNQKNMVISSKTQRSKIMKNKKNNETGTFEGEKLKQMSTTRMTKQINQINLNNQIQQHLSSTTMYPSINSKEIQSQMPYGQVQKSRPKQNSTESNKVHMIKQPNISIMSSPQNQGYSSFFQTFSSNQRMKKFDLKSQKSQTQFSNIRNNYTKNYTQQSSFEKDQHQDLLSQAIIDQQNQSIFEQNQNLSQESLRINSEYSQNKALPFSKTFLANRQSLQMKLQKKKFGDLNKFSRNKKQDIGRLTLYKDRISGNSLLVKQAQVLPLKLSQVKQKSKDENKQSIWKLQNYNSEVIFPQLKIQDQQKNIQNELEINIQEFASIQY